jgi:hypothetical protein
MINNDDGCFVYIWAPHCRSHGVKVRLLVAENNSVDRLPHETQSDVDGHGVPVALLVAFLQFS